MRLPYNWRGMIRSTADGNAHLRKSVETSRTRDNRKSLDRYYNKRTTSDGTATPENWDAMVQYVDNCCLRCGHEGVTQDHVLPISLGGPHSIYNLQPLCQSCNSWKHDTKIDFRPENWPW